MAKRDVAVETVEPAKDAPEVKKYRVVLPSNESYYLCNVSNGKAIVESFLVVDFEEIQARSMRQKFRAMLEQPNCLHLKPGEVVEWPEPSTNPQNKTYVMLRAGALKEVKD